MGGWICGVVAGLALAAVAAPVPAAPRLVTVPSVTHTPTGPGVRFGTELLDGYGRLHDAGLRVSFATGVEVSSLLGCYPKVVGQIPRAGRRVPRGTVVTLRTAPVPCGLAHPGVPKPLPSARVPRFVGHPVAAVLGWATRHRLYYDTHLAPLTAGNARLLLGNYRVVRQFPAPGTRLALAEYWGSGPGTADGLTPTPVIVHAAQAGVVPTVSSAVGARHDRFTVAITNRRATGRFGRTVRTYLAAARLVGPGSGCVENRDRGFPYAAAGVRVRAQLDPARGEGGPQGWCPGRYRGTVTYLQSVPVRRQVVARFAFVVR